MQPKEFMLYYAALMVVALLFFIRASRPRKGMRLRLRGRFNGAGKMGGREAKIHELKGAQGPARVTPIRPKHERPLNVVFNYNGHSWDAYEVLGLPAGSSMEKVEAAYRESLSRVEDGSKPFMEAAFAAIQSQWNSFKASNEN